MSGRALQDSNLETLPTVLIGCDLGSCIYLGSNRPPKEFTIWVDPQTHDAIFPSGYVDKRSSLMKSTVNLPTEPVADLLPQCNDPTACDSDPSSPMSPRLDSLSRPIHVIALGDPSPYLSWVKQQYDDYGSSLPPIEFTSTDSKIFDQKPLSRKPMTFKSWVNCHSEDNRYFFNQFRRTVTLKTVPGGITVKPKRGISLSSWYKQSKCGFYPKPQSLDPQAHAMHVFTELAQHYKGLITGVPFKSWDPLLAPVPDPYIDFVMEQIDGFQAKRPGKK